MLLHSSNKYIAIIGNGGFAKEIACNLKKYSYKFYISKNFITKENINTVGAIEDIDFDKRKILLCIGDPVIRKKIVDSLPENVSYMTYIDKYARILNKETVNIGAGSIITAGCLLTTNINIGKFTIINLNTTVGHDTTIGKFVTISPGVNISGNVNIGNNNFYGSNVSIRDNVTICDNVKVGMGSTVLKNIQIPGTYFGSPLKFNI
jgi:sugar O-acyltransferase (sialic acid O-acetyltransferase NeuD family)